jgi:hypothetical protein
VEGYLEKETPNYPEEWVIIAGRFESIMEQYKDILHFFKKEVDKNYFSDYLEFVEYEMNMNLIITRLRNGFYITKKAIQKDLQRIVQNALKYNPKDSPIIRFSRFLQDICETLLKDDLTETQDKKYKEEYIKLSKGEGRESIIYANY